MTVKWLASVNELSIAVKDQETERVICRPNRYHARPESEISHQALDTNGLNG